MPVPIEKRIRAAIEEADHAFWEVIMRKFPEAETGDLAPAIADAWHNSRDSVVRIWVNTNVESKYDGLLHPFFRRRLS